MKSAFELSEFVPILQMFLPHVVTHAGPLFEALQLPEQRSRSGALQCDGAQQCGGVHAFLLLWRVRLEGVVLYEPVQLICANKSSALSVNVSSRSCVC